MTAPDGGSPAFAGEVALLPAQHAILLHGGRAIVLFEGAEAEPPRRGELLHAGATMPWTAECWRVEGEGAWCGLAVLDALPAPGAELHAAGELRRWRFGVTPRIDISPQPLADLVRRAGIDQRAVFEFLVRQLIEGRPSDCAEALAHQAFARGFFTAAADRDGFIEILARPDCGGVFAQGWSLSLQTGPATLASVAGEVALHAVEVAHFERDDILPPARGFALYGKDWPAERADDVDAVFFEREGRLLRLDVVASSVHRIAGPDAGGHVGHMLSRLAAADPTLRAFRRICRPRYAGEDTLSATRAPLAAGFDAVLEAPDGGLLVMGWLLDPLRRARLALIRSDAHLYAPVQDAWVRLPRPDLCAGFAPDPRFAGLLDPEDALYGFIAHVPASRAETKGAQVYLELVLDDESCLFRPLAVTPFPGAERLRHVLAALSPTEPELGRIVDDHLTPFLAAVPSRAAAAPRDGARPIPLGPARPARAVSAIMPARSLAELQPVLALLAGSPEADALDLVIVAGRAAAAELLTPLGEAFAFYGLGGALVVAADRDTLAARLDSGVAASSGPRVLAWSPAVLPKAPGWLTRLVAASDGLPEPGLVSPAMTYEDGSVYFGGATTRAAAAGPLCAVAGYAASWLDAGAPARRAAGAAEIALVDRALLDRAGGFAGRLFSDAYAPLDLADRLARTGAGTWCAGGVAFWMLEDPLVATPDPFDRLLQRVDAGLLARRASDPRGDRQS